MARPGQGDVEQASLLRMRMRFRLRHHEVEQRIVGPFGGESPGIEADQDHVVGLEALRAVDRLVVDLER